MTRIENILLWVAVILIVYALFSKINYTDLSSEEPRRAVISMEMVMGGQYLIPHVNGWPYFNKPPLFNWVLAIFFKVLNSFDEWVVRLPSMIALMMTAVINYFLARMYLDRKTSILGSLMFITTADLFFYGSTLTGELDFFFTLIVYLQVISIIHFYIRKDYRSLYLVSYFFLAMGIMCKGLPSLAIQGLTLLGLSIFEKKPNILINRQHIYGILLMTLIIGAYLFLYHRTGHLTDLLARQFIESYDRSFVKMNPGQNFMKILTYPIMWIQWLLPWSVLAIFLFRKSLIPTLKSNNFIIYSTLFILFNIPVYWFSNYHKARYLYIFFPFLMNILVWVYSSLPTKDSWQKRVLYLFLLVCFILPIPLLVTLPFLEPIRSIDNIYWIISILLSISLILLYLFFRLPRHRIILLIILLSIIRIGENEIYFPSFKLDNQGTTWRYHANQVLSITGKKPVYLAGEPYELIETHRMRSFHFADTAVITPPLIAYEVVYYITKGNQEIMKYHLNPQKGNFYISEVSYAMEKNILYLFLDASGDKNLCLFREE